MQGEAITILLIEDDPAHAEIVRRNFENFRVANTIIHLADGEVALDYLHGRGQYREAGSAPRPGIILLDLRLPKVDGLQVMADIKNDPTLMTIPVVILTTSAAEKDMAIAYQHHANSYLVKPVDFSQFAELMAVLGYYWLVWNRHPYVLSSA